LRPELALGDQPLCDVTEVAAILVGHAAGKTEISQPVEKALDLGDVLNRTRVPGEWSVTTSSGRFDSVSLALRSVDDLNETEIPDGFDESTKVIGHLHTCYALCRLNSTGQLSTQGDGEGRREAELFYMRDGQAGRTSTWREPHAEHFISRAPFCAVAGKSRRAAHTPNRKQRCMR